MFGNLIIVIGDHVHNLRRLMVSPGLLLEMTTTVRAPAENTLPWSPGIWEEEPSLSRALPEFMVGYFGIV